MVLEPFITRDASGKEILAEEGFAMAAKALRGFGSELTSMDVARAQSLLAGSLTGRISDLAEGARMMEGTAAVKEAQDKIIDLMQYVTQLSGSAKYYKNRKMNLVQMVANGFKNIEGYNAALDSARIARNLDTTYGRLGNMLSEPALKYALKSGDNAQDIVLGRTTIVTGKQEQHCNLRCS